MWCSREHFAEAGFVDGAHKIERVAVGEKLWLFRKFSTDNGKRDSTPCNQLLIWAHGVQTLISNQFQANRTIAWLCPHGSILESVRIWEHLDERAVKCSETTPVNALIQNYTLSKMPGHQPNRPGVQDMNESYSDIQYAMKDRRIAMDVLTVRNRFLRGIDLEEIIETLDREQQGRYPIIVLSCCRGGRFTPSGPAAPKHSPRGNPLNIIQLPGYSNLNR